MIEKNVFPILPTLGLLCGWKKIFSIAPTWLSADLAVDNGTAAQQVKFHLSDHGGSLAACRRERKQALHVEVFFCFDHKKLFI
jgi:hypothetical protein